MGQQKWLVIGLFIFRLFKVDFHNRNGAHIFMKKASNWTKQVQINNLYSSCAKLFHQGLFTNSAIYESCIIEIFVYLCCQLLPEGAGDQLLSQSKCCILSMHKHL